MTKLYLSVEPADRHFRLNRDHKKRLLKVMRLKINDELQVVSPGKQFLCRLKEIRPEEVILEILQDLPIAARPGLHLVLAQAIPKGDRFEWLIQKATELGVAEIFPLITDRTIVRPVHASEKIQRWNEIAEHSAGQCENPYPAQIHPPQSLSSFLTAHAGSGLKLLLHERDGAPLKEIAQSYDSNNIIFIVGPEGGWTETESRQISAAQYVKIHLGPRILRAETAGLVLAALLQYELGDF